MINRILLYNSGGGIGDALQILPLINSLKNEFKKANFFYLCAHENHFNSSLKDLNCHINTLNLDIKYFGFRWWHPFIIKNRIKKHKIDKFDLIIDLQSKIRNSLILKIIPHKYFISPCFNYKFCNPVVKLEKMNRLNNNILLALNKIFKTKCELIEYNLNNIENKFSEESKKLLPKNNYVGFSISQGNVYRKKEWPINNIVNLCDILKKNNKTPVFFIEKKNTELKNKIQQLIPYSLFPEHESNLSSPALVVCLGKRLDFAITIDNGIMHMLSLSKVPMISLFGPTDSKKFAPEYEKSVVLDSKKIHNTKNISSITVEDVQQAVERFVSS